jgi:hypothetical protein
MQYRVKFQAAPHRGVRENELLKLAWHAGLGKYAAT